MNVHKMVGFVNQVEFADGKIWVPNRQNLDNAVLLKVLPPSAEEQRLTDIYRKRGMPALIAELRRRYPGASVAETGHLDLHRRAEIGVAVVSATAAHAAEVLTECERTVAGHPEIELLSARQRLFSEEE